MKNESGDVLGVISFILGILSIVSILSSPVNSIVIGVVGLVFGLIDKRKGSSTWGKRGIWLNIIGIVLAVIFFVVVFSYLRNHPGIISQLGGLNGA